MQLSNEKILLPIEACYIKKLGRVTIANILSDELGISIDAAESYLNGNELRTTVDAIRLLALSYLGISVYFTTLATITDAHLSIPRLFDAFQILEEHNCLELSLSSLVLPLTTEIVMTYLVYTSCWIFKKIEDPITVRVKVGLWHPDMCGILANKRKAYEEIVYCNGEPIYGANIGGVRPSCLDVWTNHLEEKYFNKWRKALRIIKARRFRDVNAAIPWMIKCPLGLNYEYTKLVKDHSLNEQTVAVYRSTGILPENCYSMSLP